MRPNSIDEPSSWEQRLPELNAHFRGKAFRQGPGVADNDHRQILDRYNGYIQTAFGLLTVTGTVEFSRQFMVGQIVPTGNENRNLWMVSVYEMNKGRATQATDSAPFELQPRDPGRHVTDTNRLSEH